MILGPYIEKWQHSRDPLDKGTVTKSTFSIKDTPKTVIAAINDDFAEAANLVLEGRGDRAVASYDNSQRDEILQFFSH